MTRKRRPEHSGGPLDDVRAGDRSAGLADDDGAGAGGTTEERADGRAAGLADEPGREHTGGRDRQGSWGDLWRAGWLRPSRSVFVVGLLAVLLGVAVTTQIGQTRQQGLENLRQSELVGILDSVTQRSARLDEEIARLTQERDRLQREQGLDPAQARAAATQRADTLGILAGTVAARGPGVQITITDTDATVGSNTLLDAIQELRDAGAEAIQVGGVRVVAGSYVTQDGDAVAVDGQPLSSPYTILAIGDPQTLASAMAIPGGVVETVRGVGAGIDVAQSQDVRVFALHAPATPRYARPESSPSPTSPTATG